MNARIIHSRISLSPGWTARIATGGQGLPPAFATLEFPNASLWLPFLKALIDRTVPAERIDVLKDSPGGCVWRVREPLPGRLHTIICRSWPPRSHVLSRLRSRLRLSAPLLHWRKATRLIGAGVHTALPLVLCEPATGRNPTWLITTDVEQAVDLDTIVLTGLPRLDDDARRTAKRRLQEPIADLLVRLVRFGIYHRDLKASNLLFTDWSVAPQAWIVDVEGVRSLGWGRSSFPLVRLASSLLSYRQVSTTDYVRVLHAYLRHLGASQDAWRSLFRTLSRKAQRHRRSAQGRRRFKLDGFAAD